MIYFYFNKDILNIDNSYKNFKFYLELIKTIKI